MIPPLFIIFFAAAGAGAFVPSLLRRARGAFELKAAGADIDFPITWDLDAGETIAESTWSAAPSEAGGLVVEAGTSVIDDAVTACRVSGGIYRRVYELTNTVTTSAGRLLVATVTIRIGPVGAA